MLTHVMKKCGKTRRIWKAKPYLGASADDGVKVRMKGQAARTKQCFFILHFPLVIAGRMLKKNRNSSPRKIILSTPLFSLF